MDSTPGLRERKKVQTRHRLGDVAARLFAERGYDAVAVSDVARAADVSDQTVYNYFPTKPELVLDRAEEILERSRRVVAERGPEATPADAIRGLVLEDINRFSSADLNVARGEFPAQCLQSETLRRFALEFRHDQTKALAQAIVETNPELPFLLAFSHASALVGVIQAITDRIGTAVLTKTSRVAAAAQMRRDATIAFADAAENFRGTKARASTTSAKI